MGLFSGLLLLPLAPVRGVVWLSEQMLEQANREINDPALIYQQLAEVEQARAAGEITAQESAQAEEMLVARLMQVRGGYSGEWEA
jgi:regulator of sirC expression with transglutaminase-like and TPR domain